MSKRDVLESEARGEMGLLGGIATICAAFATANAVKNLKVQKGSKSAEIGNAERQISGGKTQRKKFFKTKKK